MQQAKPLTPQELQRQAADLERRQRELDAREAYLVARERILEEGPLNVKVLQETINAKRSQLYSLRQQLKDLTDKHVTRKQEYALELKGIRDERDKITSRYLTMQRDVSDREKLIEMHDVTIATLESTVTERTYYQRDQEKLIEASIDEGNAALRGIGYEIQGLEDTRDSIKQEVIELDQKKIEAAFEFTQVRKRIEDEHALLLEKVKGTKEDLKQGQAKIEKLMREELRVKADVEAHHKLLDVREQSLLIKQDALQKDRAELETDKRRWHSTKSLYDVN